MTQEAPHPLEHYTLSELTELAENLQRTGEGTAAQDIRQYMTEERHWKCLRAKDGTFILHHISCGAASS